MALPKRIIFATIATAMLVWGIWDCITNVEENGCEMTWMFEYPKYMNIPLDDEIKETFPHYKLYVYGEGSYARQISNMQFSGIPVLFIPGNAGSYKQVRSLGSVSLRMAEKPDFRFHFNYFAVDFNEEFSALHGGLLFKQTEFVNKCIKTILKLYRSATSRPSSVILVGHSMGGVLARALFTLKDFDLSTVHTIITQASPHQSPVVVTDGQMDAFYQHVNNYWRDHSNTTLAYVTVVSTGGGFRDYQVRSGLTSLKGLLPENRGIGTTSMSVPLAWVSTDHLCSVWCRQMVLATVRALFDIVDKKTLQVTTDVDLRMRVFKHHFLDYSGIQPVIPGGKYIRLDSKVPWEVRMERSWHFTSSKIAQSKYIAVPVASNDGESIADSLTIISNITAADWVCACQLQSGQEKCSDCVSLSSEVRWLPPRYSNRQVLRMSMAELGENTHIVIFLPKGASMVELLVDRYSIDSRHLVYTLPGIYDTIISLPFSILDGTAMLHIHNNSVFYSLHLAGLSGPLSAYTAVVRPKHCKKIKPGMYEGSIITLNVPWSHENTYHFAKYGEVAMLPVKLQTPRQPPSYEQQRYDHSEAHLEMYLHPGCHYQLRLVTSLGSSMGQFVRFYIYLLPVCFVVVLALALGGQLAAAAKGETLWVPDAVFQFSKPFYIVPVAMILHTVASMKPVKRILDDMGVPSDDINELVERELWIQLLPVMLFMMAWLITILHTYLIHFILAAVSRMLGLAFFWMPQVFLNLARTFQLALSLASVLVALSLCGAAGVCISYCLLVVKVMRLYFTCTKYEQKTEWSKYNIYLIVALIYMWWSIINAPALVVWASGFHLRSSFQLLDDPSRFTGCLATVLAFSFLYKDGFLLESYRLAAGLRWTIYFISVIMLPYSLIHIYYINAAVSLILGLVGFASLPAMSSLVVSKDRTKDE